MRQGLVVFSVPEYNDRWTRLESLANQGGHGICAEGACESHEVSLMDDQNKAGTVAAVEYCRTRLN
jgi:hypothetical protein